MIGRKKKLSLFEAVLKKGNQIYTKCEVIDAINVNTCDFH